MYHLHAANKDIGTLSSCRSGGGQFKTLGVIGFNIIEEYGIKRWCHELFPDFKIHTDREKCHEPALDGLIVSEVFFPTLSGNFQQGFPILVLTNGRNHLQPRNDLCLIDIVGGELNVKQEIAEWLRGLHVVGIRGNTDRTPRLGPREAEVMHLLGRGFSNEAIAQELGIQLPTVKTHLQRVYTKLGAVNRAHAVAIYLALSESR